jgi:SAM-dependent methyltransferase
VRCDGCDLEFVDPMPSEAELATVYAHGYFTGEGFGYSDYFGRERADADAKARDRVRRLIDAGARRDGRWLDIGCADGRFLLEAKRIGAETFGVEPSREARERANAELPGRIVASLDEVGAHAPFDVVTFWDVLEHLTNPFDALRAIAPRLARDAFVAIVVPVIDNVNARVAPGSWDQYKPPEHLWFFSRRSVRATLAATLGVEVLVETSAWRRDARVALPRVGDGVVRRLVGRFEGRAWSLLRGARVVPERWFDDSVLWIARR